MFSSAARRVLTTGRRQYTQFLAAPVALPELPYPADSFGADYSAETFSYHHGKHHNAYVVKAKELIEGTPLENATVGEIIKASEGVLFNQAAQIFNHSFFWSCLAPGGGGAPAADSAIGAQIAKDFGSYDNFVAEFGAAAAGNFGSGWTWLVYENGKLAIVNTGNAGYLIFICLSLTHTLSRNSGCLMNLVCMYISVYVL